MANPGNPKEILQQTVNALEKYGTALAAARALKIPRATFESRLRAAKTANVVPNNAGVDKEMLAARERVAMQDRIRDLEAEVKAMHRDQLTEDKVRDKIFGLATTAVKPPAWAVASMRKGDTPGVPMVLWSDWHWGEVVKPAQVNGVNVYNLAVARDRLRRLVSRTIGLCFQHMVHPSYPGIVVNLGGDMISGDIHDELAETNELPSGPTVLDLTENLVWALDALAERFGRVWVIGVAGNHGRMSHRPRFKDRQFTNFDWVVYHLLRMHFAKDKRFDWMIPDGADAHYEVAGHRYLLTHGDNLGVKGGDGIISLFGPIIRGDFKMRNASTAINRPYDTLLMGHWHTYIPLRRVIVNGSLKGFDEFAHVALRAVPEPAMQALWFTHPRFGITSQWPIFCDQEREPVTGPVVSWRQAA